jgi:hypothetical protein
VVASAGAVSCALIGAIDSARSAKVVKYLIFIVAGLESASLSACLSHEDAAKF